LGCGDRIDATEQKAGGMAGRELIRELHEASYRRLAIELLAYVDDLGAAEDTAREAFAAAYRDGRAVDAAVSPHEELRQRALDAIRRRESRERMLGALRRRAPAPEPTRRDPRLSADAHEVLDAVTSLPHAEREAAVLHYLAELPDDEASSTMSSTAPTPEAVRSLLARADAALRAAVDREGDRYRQRIDDLAVDLRHAIGMPSFEDVVATASRHRRRMLASVVAAAAVVTAGVVVSVGGSPASTPAADPLAGVPRATAAVRTALQEPDTTMYAVARTADGVWASFWFCRSCAVERSFALLSRDGFQHVQVVPLFTDGQGDAWATASGDFVVSSGINGVLQVVSPGGTVRNVGGLSSAPPMPAGRDDLVVTSLGVGAPNVPMVIDPSSLRQWPLTVSDFNDPGAVSVVDSYPDGDLWGLHMFAARSGLVHSDDGGRTWSSFLFPSAHGGVRQPRAVTPFGPPLVSASGTIGFLSLPAGRPNPNHPELLISADGGETWERRGAPRDTEGRPVTVYAAALTASGAVVVRGVDSDGVARVWLAPDGADGYHSLRPVLQESVTFARPPLDRPDALWATAPRAIWESDDAGRTWDLLISHQTWQNIEVVGG
jgi:RNA polymerase sigma-70 factor, ECF subfamily